MRHGSGNNGGNRRQRNRNNGRRNNNNGNNSAPNRSQVFDSNGPDVRIRGTAHQIVEKYAALAKDSSSAGDLTLTENYLQHAEHYQRMISEWDEMDRIRNERKQAAQKEQEAAEAAEAEKAPEKKESEDLGLPASVIPAAVISEEIA